MGNLEDKNYYYYNIISIRIGIYVSPHFPFPTSPMSSTFRIVLKMR